MRGLPFLSACGLGIAAASLSAFAQTSVLTYHNDNFRSGQNLAETILTPQNVTSSTFGKLFEVSVDGKVDAQPLYVSALAIPGHGTRNVVFAATEHDSLYAFDADNGTLYWHVSLLGSGETTSDDRGCSQVTPEIGITATPVIDLAAGPHGAIYAVAMSKTSSGNYYQRLHALDLLTGAEQFGGPVTVQASVPGTGDNSSSGNVVFDAKQYKSRPGLLLLNGVVYTSWGSHCDFRPYTGWLIGYNETTLNQTSVFNFAPNGSEAALWNSGGAPAADSQGNIFVAVANGTFDTSLNAQGFPTGGDYGNAFVKLTLQNNRPAVADYWTMDNSDSESNSDIDLGSGGILLLPDMTDTSGRVRHLAVGAGKDTNLWVVDRDNMGKYDSQANATIYQALIGALPGGIFSSPAYFDGRVYFGSVSDVIRAFEFNAARLSTSPASTTSTSFAYPGATPGISANGSSNAILWAAENTSTAVLHAYDATNLGTELYNSNQAAGGRDHFGAGNKFITPTIANGKVFIGTQNSVAAFGLLQPPVTVTPDSIQISAASGGFVWSINSSGQIYTFNAQTNSWTQTPGSLSAIAAGPNGTAWGLNSFGSIYRWDPSAQSWDYVPGNLAQIAVGSDGDVWGLNSSQQIYHFSAQAQTWTWIPGALTQISVGYDGAVWGLNSEQSIYRFNPGAQVFEQVPGALVHIFVGADGAAWGINGAGQVYRFDRVAATWDYVPGAITQLAVGSDANVWGLGASGQVYQYNAQTQTWEGRAGTFARIAAAEDGSVWGLEASGQVNQLAGSTPSQLFHQVAGSLTQVAVGADGTVWGLNSSGQIWAFDSSTSGWTYIPGALTQISVGGSGNVWGVNSSGQIYRYDQTQGGWQNLPGSLSHISAAVNGDVWGLNNAGEIYRFNSSTQSWTHIDGTLTQIAIGADGAAWGLNSANQIFQFDSMIRNWTSTPGSLVQIAVGSSANVWGLNAAGSIYRFDSQTRSWNYVPGNLSQIAVGFDGSVWGVDSMNQVLEWNSASQTWAMIPGALAKISVAADGAVWGLDPGSGIYVYH